MKKSISLLLKLFLLFFPSIFFGQPTEIDPGEYMISIEWNEAKPVGIISVLNGELSQLNIAKGAGLVRGDTFEFHSEDENRLTITLHSVQDKPGSDATIVTVNTKEHPFSFFVRDVTKEFPVYIPTYKVVVLQSGDHRSYEEAEADIKGKKLLSKLEQIENEPEASFESAKESVRNQTVPTWLGISRDIRIFEISQALEDSPSETDIISPKNSSRPLTLQETGDRAAHYLFTTGRGQGVESNVSRRLEEGVLPILHSKHVDGEISYHSVAFASLEKSPLDTESSFGTNFWVADHFSAGHMFTAEQQEIVNEKLAGYEKEQSEQTVLYYRVKATNTAQVPRYAWYKTPRPGRGWWDQGTDYSFDQTSGFSAYSEDRVFSISKFNGNPLPDEEMAVLLQPGETATFEFYLPHSPVSHERAERLSTQDFEVRYHQAKKFWKYKLEKAATIHLPEKRIEEMIQAGLLHLDLITYGKEPDDTLAPLIGVYSPIGTESSPIIQFYSSMGWHETAKRSLKYFLEKQHDDGMIQNFGGYMVETGAALWSMGEYFRYTNDEEWVQQVKPQLLKSSNFLLDWRELNKMEELKGKGYGMIDGKVADPDDPFRQYMLNAYAYLGISRVAEMLQSIDPENSERLKQETEAWKQDILDSFYNSMAHSPVVPLGDGTWSPTVPPWPGTAGPQALLINEGTIFSHGTFTVADVLLGPLYLVFGEVLEPDAFASRMMLETYSELFFQNNVALSQPYYSRHDWLQLKLGRVKPFLKTYYQTFSALADRETYTFWEHLYRVSPHKTHEEGWFLMQTRWMLYIEEGQTLRLLPGIPRKWMEDGKSIRLENAASYFGPFSLYVDSNVHEGTITANIRSTTERKPETIVLRIPHPEEKKPGKVEGGIYDEQSETITISPFEGEATIRMEFYD